MSGCVYMMSDKPRGVIYTGVTSDLHGLVEGFNPTWMDLYERIDELENIYRPHPNRLMWNDYN